MQIFSDDTKRALRRIGTEVGLPEPVQYIMTVQYDHPKGRIVAYYIEVRLAGMELTTFGLKGADLWSDKNLALMRKKFTKAAQITNKL